jgi:hypothetical protein
MLSFTRVSESLDARAKKTSAARKTKRPRRTNQTAAREPARMGFGAPPFAVAACVLLACVDAATARRVVRGGESAGGPAPQGYGELDETTFITVMAFVGLGVVFCALAALSRRGASRLARLDAQLAAARGVREVEAGDFGGDFGGSRSDPCAVGDVVSLIRKGVRVEGTGVVTRADARRDSYRVRWSRELSDTFTYRPVAGGPLLRARRRPGPKRGWRREDLLAETPPAEARAGAGGTRDCLAAPRGFSAAYSPAPSARALEGLWVATWHAPGDPDDGVSSTTFELALELIETHLVSGADDAIVARLRSTEGAEPAASASAHLATRRFAMEIGTVDATRGFAAEAFFDGTVAFDEDARCLTVTGGWLGADGAFGAASMRRVGSSSESFGAPSAEKATRARNGRAAAGASLRTPSGARARWRAAARAARTHGLIATLRAGSGASLVVEDGEDDVVAEDTDSA